MVRIIVQTPRRYGIGRFLWDLFLIGATGGLWLLWLILKFLRNGRR